MKCKSLVALSVLLLVAGPALADQKIGSVQVRPETTPRLAFECARPQAATPADVEKLLDISDHSQTHQLSERLMGVVESACRAGADNIVVQRGSNYGSLTWRPAREFEASVALR
jgi:hypothetical protein